MLGEESFGLEIKKYDFSIPNYPYKHDRCIYTINDTFIFNYQIFKDNSIINFSHFPIQMHYIKKLVSRLYKIDMDKVIADLVTILSTSSFLVGLNILSLFYHKYSLPFIGFYSLSTDNENKIKYVLSMLWNLSYNRRLEFEKKCIVTDNKDIEYIDENNKLLVLENNMIIDSYDMNDKIIDFIALLFKLKKDEMEYVVEASI